MVVNEVLKMYKAVDFITTVLRVILPLVLMFWIVWLCTSVCVCEWSYLILCAEVL